MYGLTRNGRISLVRDWFGIANMRYVAPANMSMYFLPNNSNSCCPKCGIIDAVMNAVRAPIYNKQLFGKFLQCMTPLKVNAPLIYRTFYGVRGAAPLIDKYVFEVLAENNRMEYLELFGGCDLIDSGEIDFALVTRSNMYLVIKYCILNYSAPSDTDMNNYCNAMLIMNYATYLSRVIMHSPYVIDSLITMLSYHDIFLFGDRETGGELVGTPDIYLRVFCDLYNQNPAIIEEILGLIKI
jgi:hypothetical protein